MSTVQKTYADIKIIYVQNIFICSKKKNWRDLKKNNVNREYDKAVGYGNTLLVKKLAGYITYKKEVPNLVTVNSRVERA